jgi:hypothetical protein
MVDWNAPYKRCTMMEPKPDIDAASVFYDPRSCCGGVILTFLHHGSVTIIQYFTPIPRSMLGHGDDGIDGGKAWEIVVVCGFVVMVGGCNLEEDGSR